MASRKQIFVAVFLCGAIGFAAPSFAATINHGVMYHSFATHKAAMQHRVKDSVSYRGSRSIDLRERQRTSDLNRQSLVGVGPQAQDTNPNDAASGG